MPWIVVSVIVYTIFHLGALISSFLMIKDRRKVNVENIRRRDAENRKEMMKSVRSRGKSSDKPKNGEKVPLKEK